MHFHLQYFSYTWHDRFLLLSFIISKIRQYYLQSGNILLTVTFIAFDFVLLFNLNSNPNNLVEVFFIRVFLIACLMCLNISLIVLKMSKSSLLWSILTNLQPNCFSVGFRSQYWCRCVHFHWFLLRIYSQSYNFKTLCLHVLSFKWTHYSC